MSDGTEIQVAAAGGKDVAASGQGSPAGSMLNFIAQALENPAIDVSKLEALLRMQREVAADDAKAQFGQAMHRLQGKLPRITKNGAIDIPTKDGKRGGRIPFARWEDIDGAIKPILTEEGFSLSFTSRARQADGGGLVVVGKLLHVGGHFEEAEMALPLDTGPGRNNLQAMGSSFSYGKRYTATMLLNLVTEGQDDDGKSGGTKIITEAQHGELVKALRTLPGDFDAQVDAMCRWLNIPDLTQMAAVDFTRALNGVAAKAKALKS